MNSSRLTEREEQLTELVIELAAEHKAMQHDDDYYRLAAPRAFAAGVRWAAQRPA